MNKVISFTKEFGISIASLLLPLMASAQLTAPTAPTQVGSIPQANNLNSLQSVLQTVCVVFSWLFYFLVALTVVFIVIAAFKYLTAAGNPEKVSSAGSTLLYAAIAIAVALLARAIPNIVSSFLGGGSISSC